MSSDLENISGDIYDLTKVNGKGISIFTDETRSTYKSTYEILKEIAGVWDELTDKQQADLLDKLGGKRGAQSIAGILADFDEVERAMSEMENAAGSADKEMGVIRDSLEFKINALKQTWVGTLQEITDRGDIGNIVDKLTAISEGLGAVISKLGIAKTAFIGLSTVVGSQKFGIFGSNGTGFMSMLSQASAAKKEVSQYRGVLAAHNTFSKINPDYLLETDFSKYDNLSNSVKKNLKSIQDEVIKTKGTGEDAFNKIGVSMTQAEGRAEAATSSIKKFGTTLLNAFTAFAISTAISLAIQGIQDLINSSEDLAKESSDIANKFNQEKTQIDDYSKKIVELKGIMDDSKSSTEEVASATSELYDIQNNLISTYGAYHEGIDLVNGDLEEQLSILQQINRENAQQAINDINANRSALSSGWNILGNLAEYTAGTGATGGIGNLPAQLRGLSKYYENLKAGNGFWDSFTKTWTESDLYGKDIGLEQVGSSVKQITDLYEDFNAEIKATDNSTINELIDSFEEFKVEDGMIKVSGSVDEVSEAVVKLQTQLKSLGYEDENLNNQLTNIANTAQEVVSNTSEAYNTILYDRVQNDANLLNYYLKLTELYNKLQTAQAEGDTKKADQEEQYIKDLFEEIYSDENIDQKYVKYFENLYPDLQNIISNWKFEVEVLPSIDLTSGFTGQLGTEDYLKDNSLDQILSDYIRLVTEGNSGSGTTNAIFKALADEAEKADTDVVTLINNLKKLPQYSDKFSSIRNLMGDNWKDEYADLFTDQEISLSVELEKESVVNVEERLTELEKGGTVDLNVRPEIDVNELNKVGWDAGEGYATVFTNTYSNEAGTKYLNFTPIIVDPETGQYKGVMSPGELQEYAEGVIAGTREDDLNLQIGAEFDSEQAAEDAAEEIHNLHEAKAEGLIEFTPERDYDTLKEEFSEKLSPITVEIEPEISNTDAVESLDNLEDTFGDLSTAYLASVKNENSNGNVANASDLQGVTDAFGGVTEIKADTTVEEVNALSNAIEEYNSQLIENKGDTKVAQDAADKLATAYVDQSGILDNLTEENKDYYIQQLKANGVTNAAEVVESRLSKQAKLTATNLTLLSKKLAYYSDAINESNKGTDEYNDAMESIADTTKELLSTYDDAGTAIVTPEIDSSFIEQNLEDIKAATEGDIDALDRLRLAAARLNASNAYIDVSLPSDVVSAQLDNIMSKVAQVDAMDIEVGAYVDDAAFLAELSNMIGSSQSTANAVAAAFESMGYTVEWQDNPHTITYTEAQISGVEAYSTSAAAAMKQHNVEVNMPSLKIKRTSSGSSGSKVSYGGSGSKSSSSNGGSSDGSSGSSEDTEETFDWVEQKLTRLEENLERINTQVDDTYKNWTNRNEELGKAINQVSEEIKAQEKAAEIYQAKADAVNWGSTSEETKQAYITKIKNGEIIDTNSIETIKNNETLVNAINEYKEWYDLSVEAADTGKELAVTLKDYYKDLFDNIQSEYDDLIEDIEKQADTIDERISRTEERGFFVDKAYYDSLLTLESQKTEKLSTELDLLMSKLNNQVENGQIEKYSESWYEMYNTIQDVNIALEESYTRTAELNNEIRQLSWDAFDWVEERMDDFAEEADFLIGLLQGEETIDNRGYFNNRGFANAALIGAKYDDALAEAQRYKEQIAKIDEQIATTEGAYDKNLIERKEELVDAYRDAIEAAEDEKQAMKSLVEEAVKQHLDYLSKLIDKYKDALSTMKSTYEYAKNINDQTKNIGNLEKQLAAYQGDTSEETRKKRQELQSQLDAAQQQLEETQWDKYISETGEMLDNLYNDYETYLNDKLSNVSELMNTMIDMINQGTYTVPGAVTLGMNNILSQLSGNGSITTAVKDTTISIQTGMDEIKSEYDLTTQNFEKFGDTANGTKNILSGWSNGKYTNESTFKTKLDEVKEKFEKVTNGAADTIKKAITENSVDVKSNDEAGHVSKQKTYVDPNAGSGGGGGGGEQPTSGQDPNSTGNATSNAGWYQREGLDLWFFRNEDGTDKQAEWFRDDENGGWWYWFDPGGVMARDEYVSDDNGDFWYLDDSGHMMPNKFNWHQDDNGWWFGSDDGSYVHDEEVTINGERWRFNHAGYKYAKGTKGVPNNQLAWTQEEGSEIIYRTTDGALLTPLGKGDMVFTNAMSQRLWDIASGSMPFGFNLDSPNVSANANQNVTANNSITIELPNVQNYDDFKREMKQDRDLEKFWQEITIGQMMGNARLKKNKY